MNIAFWILVILAAVIVWVVATYSLFSARVGNQVVNIYENVKKNMEIERDKDVEHW